MVHNCEINQSDLVLLPYYTDLDNTTLCKDSTTQSTCCFTISESIFSSLSNCSKNMRHGF